MGDVGLLLVGVVLFVNGLSTLGVVPARSAAPLNFFVGTAQVLLPTIVLVQHGTEPGVLQATWPSYLFGITYLWFGLLTVFRIEPQGFGWYSIFVAGIATYYAVTTVATDPAFAVIWATWAVMWTLFFLLLGLGRTHVGTLDLGRFAGWFLVLLGIPTCTVPALLIMAGRWSTSPAAGVAALAALALATAASVALARRPAPATSAPTSSAPTSSAPTTAAPTPERQEALDPSPTPA
ncbi:MULTISPECIES: AmiS/UreI family transporter [unclassified Actinotalea]|uniref:AmiS/UreI family transporter n=1 Tax=unclassified Actinotalea TaxID=2638618 RepID=UPI0015F5F960|nr:MULTISPECIES: AmiS/UreI family transporter [unclassified Actinotalea]